ncbi:RNA polymerase sigma factor [Inhella crocodyli]|jgi:RNA polymerase sigma-70 factor (ECF subfamily)|uniref:RNA polymerase sigma factor n=1 Tax=Inhella crocodyli TaxID=2499851 RepID=A0A3S2VCQ7_9BURK|nr:RNA polymerase sigma factor [Inhella crocodyli]RVT83637.1 RNA polymerase sigma factor [Inhella crocodyli]
MLSRMSWLSRLGFVAATPGRGGDEAALLARALAGDEAALSLLYRRESGPVYRYALALCGDEAAALDAMQEAFAQLLQRPEAFEPGRGSLGAYLAGIARHQLLARWREARRLVQSAGGTEVDDLAEGGDPADASGQPLAPATDALLVRAQDSAALWAAIRRLPWSQREALTLVDLQERSYDDAARVAGVSTDVLRTRLHRARHRLALLLGAGDPP